MADDRRCIIPIQVAQDSATLLKQLLDPRKVLDTGCRVIKHPHCCAICAANNDCKKVPVHVMCRCKPEPYLINAE